MEKSRELTRAELDIMQILWQKENLYLSEIIAAIEEPRPAYTTISTIVRILVKKGFVSYKGHGKQHCYYPVVTKEEYTSSVMQQFKINFFGGSISNMISFFAKKENLSPAERRELLEMIETED